MDSNKKNSTTDRTSIEIIQLQPKVYKASIKGVFKLVDYHKLHLEVKNIQNKSINDQAYLLIDFNEFETIALETKKWVSENKSPFISSVVFIIYGLNNFPRSVIRFIFQNSVTLKLFEVQNEIAAIQRVNELLSQYQMNNLAVGPSAITGVEKSKIKIANVAFDLVHDKKWAYKHPEETYFYEIDLIDYNVFVSRPSGYVEYNNSLTANVLFDKVIQKMIGDEGSYYRIQDYSNVVSSSLGARRDFTNYISNNINRINLMVFFGLNTYMKAMVRFGKLFNPNFSKIKIANNFEDALRLVFEHKYGPEIFNDNQSEKNSKFENPSAEIVQNLEEEIRLLKTNQQTKIDLLFNAISNILWENNADDILKNQDDSAFSDVFAALSILRKDLTELLDEKDSLINDMQSQIEEFTKDLLKQKKEFNKLLYKKDEQFQLINHALRTPAQTIISGIELLRNSDSPEENDKLLKIISDSGSLLFKKVSQLKNYSDNNIKHIELSASVFNIHKVIQSQIDLRYPLIHAKNLTVKFETDHNIPDYLTGDLDKINQILDHFIDNAIRFTNQGKIILRTFLLEDLETQMKIRVEVEDTGIGMNADIQKYLFDETKLWNNYANEMDKRIGLGLFICKQLVEFMGGNIGFSSEAGVGSVFYFEIILNRGVFSKEMNLLSRKLPFPVLRKSQKENIKALFFTYPDANLEITQKMFENLKLKVNFANNLDHLLSLIKSDDYNLIFLDLPIQVDSDENVITKIRNHKDLTDTQKSISIVLITTEASEEYKEKCMNSGVSQVVLKPYSIKAIKRALDAIS